MSDIRFSGQTAKTESPVARYQELRTVSGPALPTQTIRDTVTVQQLSPSFEYGAETKGTFVALGTDDKANVGDTLRITYKLKLAFLERWQTDNLVRSLNADGRFELNHVALNEETRLVSIEVRVLKPFSPAILVAIAIVGVVAGALIWITMISIERLATVDVAGTKIKLTPILVFGGLILGGIVALAKLKSAG